jgi:hypothetical protein
MSTKLDQELKAYYRQFDASQQRLRDRLAAHFDVEERPTVGAATVFSQKARHSTWWIWPSSAITAAILVAVGLWIAAVGNPQALYAQAIRAIQQAQTIHAVAYRFEDGQPRKRAEVWYDKDRGVREVGGSQVGNEFVAKYERLDNGEHQWRLESKSKTIIKKASVNPVGVVIELVRPERTLKDSVREPSLDRKIDHEKCQACTKVLKRGAGHDPQFRVCVWLDRQGRIRRFEEHEYKGGQWERDELVEVEFDVTIARERFEPNFGPDYRLVDNTPQKQPDLARFHAPDKALFVHEELGLILAVHEVARVEEDMALVVYSVQPSPQTLKELGPAAQGESQLDSSWQRINVGGQTVERCYQPLQLSETKYDGVWVGWWLLIEKGKWPKPVEQCDFSVYLYARGELGKSLEREGRPSYVQLKHLTQLPMKEKLSLQQALAHVHADALAVESVCPITLSRGSRPLTERERKERIRLGENAEVVKGMTVVPCVPPSAISPGQFEKEIRSRIGELREKP